MRGGEGPSQEVTEPHSEGQAPPAPRQWHLLCFALSSSSHVHGFVISLSEPPAERQAHAHFVFEVFGGSEWLRNSVGLAQRVSNTSVRPPSADSDPGPQPHSLCSQFYPLKKKIILY